MGHEATRRILRRARLLIDTAAKEQHVDTYTQLARHLYRHRLPLKGELEEGEGSKAKLFHGAFDQLNYYTD